MKIIRGTKNIAGPLPYPVVALGNFDGVHIGHQVIFRRVAEIAHGKDGSAVAFTFQPHPLKIIAPDKVPPLLTTFRKKMELIAVCGIDHVICANFNRKFADQAPRDFAKNVLVEAIQVKEVVVGIDYSFGKGGAGTLSYLKKMGEEFRFLVHVIEPVKIGGHRISSTRVRELLESGAVEAARELLGRDYSINGPVIHGHKTGRGIGFRTANIDTSKVQIPGTGVYAVRVQHHQKTYSGVVNIGFNPTFNRDRLSVEAHIFDFDENIYGAAVEIFFIERIRGEIAFESTEKLVAQIKQDIETAKILLTKHPL